MKLHPEQREKPVCPNCSVMALQQQGAALIVAILVVALVSMLGTAIAFSFGLTLNRQINQGSYAQAKVFLLGGEKLAAEALRNDYEESDGVFVDDCAELENYTAEFPLPEVGGFILGEVEDLAARFNINSLIYKSQNNEQGNNGDTQNGSGQTSRVNAANVKRFTKLLQALPGLEIDQGLAKELTEAVIDWIDSDDNPTGFGGKENGHYTSLSPAYKAANRPMADITELRAVAGFDKEIYQALLPYVRVWPKDGSGTINVNTAGLALMRALNEQGDEPFSLEDGQSMLEERADMDGFDDYQTFKNLNVWGGSAPQARDLQVYSNWFLYKGKVMLDDRVLSMQAVLFRNQQQQGEITIKSRAYSVQHGTASCQQLEQGEEGTAEVVES